MCEKKERHFDKQMVEICRNCQGTGRATGVTEQTIYKRIVKPFSRERPDICPVCGGSGRVVKTLNITITIEPYRKE